METIQQKQTERSLMEQKLAELEREKLIREYQNGKISFEELQNKVAVNYLSMPEPSVKEKEWKTPFKWKMKFMQSKSVKKVDQILVMMFNKKQQIEPPKFMPIYGNIIVYKDKVYRYRPKAIWTMLVQGKPQIYAIKEKDMEPISNISDARLEKLMIDSGRGTEYHKLLLQAALAAQVKPQTKPINMWLVGGVILVVVGGLLWFFLKG